MSKKNVVNVLRDGFITIPLYYYKLKKQLSLSEEEFVFLMYLLNHEHNLLFNPNFLSKQLNIEIKQVMNYVSSLSTKGLLEVKTIKNEQDILEDYILLDIFYEKINAFIIEDVNNTKEESTSLFETFEKELGKPLTPMEYEIINAWLDNNTSEEIIIGALKEAVFNGVFSLRYIDKIIFEWNKKGFKTLQDVDHHHQRRSKETKEKTQEIFEFDWLEEDE